MQLALDLKNAHVEYDRRAAQQRLVEHETAQPNSAAWMNLPRAHHSDCEQPSDVYMRDATVARGLRHVYEGRAGPLFAEARPRGWGLQATAERIPFLNSLFSALPAISGSAA